MGAFLARLTGRMEGRILLLGLDAAGKTTIMYMMKLGEVVTTIPTIGFNVETIRHKKATFTAWDIGGRSGTRALVRHYLHNTDAIIYVVDSNDVVRLDEARDQLHSYLAEDELRDAAVLVLANKQDLPNAKSPIALAEALRLHTVRQPCHIIPTVATSGDGLQDGLSWLHDAVASIRCPSAGAVAGQAEFTVGKQSPSAQLDAAATAKSETSELISDSKSWAKACELFRSLFVG